jgi:oxalate decarboxylase/phosphoglucose isomerase-like protein (cupin superfamily)
MNLTNSVFNCSVIELPQVKNRAGNITPITSNINIPFDIKRVYYLYDVPSGETRGGHAHKNLQQLIIAASGSFDVILSDGVNSRTITLNRPNYGLYVTSGIWRELVNFSSGGVLLVLASELYSEEDYIRDYRTFQAFKFNEGT